MDYAVTDLFLQWLGMVQIAGQQGAARVVSSGKLLPYSNERWARWRFDSETFHAKSPYVCHAN
jgi:hypothetical protein